MRHEVREALQVLPEGVRLLRGSGDGGGRGQFHGGAPTGAGHSRIDVRGGDGGDRGRRGDGASEAATVVVLQGPGEQRQIHEVAADTAPEPDGMRPSQQPGRRRQFAHADCGRGRPVPGASPTPRARAKPAGAATWGTPKSALAQPRPRTSGSSCRRGWSGCLLSSVLLTCAEGDRKTSHFGREDPWRAAPECPCPRDPHSRQPVAAEGGPPGRGRNRGRGRMSVVPYFLSPLLCPSGVLRHLRPAFVTGVEVFVGGGGLVQDQLGETMKLGVALPPAIRCRSARLHFLPAPGRFSCAGP